jgi:hypothetical protein
VVPSRRWSGWGVELTTRRHLQQSLIMSGAIPSWHRHRKPLKRKSGARIWTSLSVDIFTHTQNVPTAKKTSLDVDSAKYTLHMPRHIIYKDYRTHASDFKPPLNHMTSLHPTPTNLDI